MALTVGIAFLTLTSSSASAVAHRSHRVTGSPAVGGIECTFSATLKFHPSLTPNSDATRTLAAGTVSGCTTSWNFCCSTTGTASPISGGIFRAGYQTSPIDCATLSPTSAPLFGDTEIRWLASGHLWQPSNLVGGVSYGSFPGGATVTYNVPSGLASLCAGHRGIRKLNVTGAITMGPSSGPGNPPFTIYPIGGGPLCGAHYGSAGIAAGSDGALWFTVSPPCIGCPGDVGRITTAGAVTLYPVPGADPISITAGPDGALWFTGQANLYQVNATQQIVWGGSIGRITTAGVVTVYPVSGEPAGVTAGPDGALWFADGNDSIGRITTSGTVSTYSDPGIANAQNLTAGPDGALWFINSGHWVNVGTRNPTFIKGSIGRITTAGAVSSYGAGSIDASDITAGPDGALWFTEGSAQGNDIGRITTSGSITIYTDPNICSPYAITTGPDGTLWFTNYDCPATPQGSEYAGSIGRLTTSGQVTLYTSPGVYVPYAITTGSDGAMWFVSRGNDAIGRLAIS